MGSLISGLAWSFGPEITLGILLFTQNIPFWHLCRFQGVMTILVYSNQPLWMLLPAAMKLWPR